MKADVLIIGGGAAGMMCAVALKIKRPEYKVIIAEKKDRVGKKLLATGNGRCNLGNSGAGPGNFHSASGNGAAFVQPALNRFSPDDNRAFFEQLGLLITEDSAGRQYPYTNQAASVLDILRLHLASLGVEVMTDTAVCSLRKSRAFTAETENGALSADKVVLAAGGLASPQISSADEIWDCLEELGHRHSVFFPALTQIKTAGGLPKALKGLRIPCEITLETGGKAEQKEKGEVLFNDYGISGIPAFQLSRGVGRNFAEAVPAEQKLIIDTLPQLTEEEIYGLLAVRRQKFDTALENFLTGTVNKKLGQQVLKLAGAAPLSRRCSTLVDWELAAVAHLLKNLELWVLGTAGWKNAQVTAGGLLIADFSAETLESKLVPGLFAVGEVLDVDGDCGGYNLTWAWSSARLAAENL